MKSKFLSVLALCSFGVGKMNAQVADSIVVEAKDSNNLIVDVRIPEQYNEGHIEGAINIPLAQVGDSAQMLATYPKVVLVCNTGGQTNRAFNLLTEKGLTNLIDAKGWKALNDALKKEDEIETSK